MSALFGGLAGNQVGLRAAAMLVDLVRTPIYVWRAGPELIPLTLPLAIATAGALVGTTLGERILLGFRRVSSATE